MRLVLNSKNVCKSINVELKTVKLSNLKRWGANQVEHSKLLTDFTSLDVIYQNESPFTFSRKINDRFIICYGNISDLEVDAITNITDENFLTENSISNKIYRRSGHKDKLLNELKDCRIGSIKVTKGYNLPSKYIINTICPIFSQKYTTAAENSLYSLYRNILCKARELKFKTIALSNISTTQRNFPPDLGAHIVLHTIRRFLEQNQFEIVILCVQFNEKGIFEVLAPLYFPRNLLEEKSAIWHLPNNIIDCTKLSNFNSIAPNYNFKHQQKIRIIRNPQHSTMMSDDDSDSYPNDVEAGNSDIDYFDINRSNLSSHLNIGQHSFAQMQGDLDRQRLLGNTPSSGAYESVMENGIEGIEHQERTTVYNKYFANMDQESSKYERLLHRARTEDLSEVSGIGCLYQSGVDRLGRPVVVFCGKWFPANEIDLEKAMLYLIYLLDPIVKGDYVIAYFHSLTSTSNYPSLHWLKEVYSILPYKFKKNLKAFYIVHPTFWTRMMTWWFITFMAPAIKQKVINLPGVEHLYSAVSKDQLEIPAYITEYDMTINGLHYFVPQSQTTS